MWDYVFCFKWDFRFVFVFDLLYVVVMLCFSFAFCLFCFLVLFELFVQVRRPWKELKSHLSAGAFFSGADIAGASKAYSVLSRGNYSDEEMNGAWMPWIVKHNSLRYQYLFSPVIVCKTNKMC
jgi:hypothetical protein